MTLGIFFRRLDYVLIAAVAIALGYSYVTIASVSDRVVVRHQLTYVAIGTVLAIAVALIDPKRYRRFAWFAYVVVAGLLITVLGFAAARGSSRWITLPGFTLQPSEIAKIVVIVVLAAYVSDRSRETPGRWRTFIAGLAIAGWPALLVFLEPDLGTSLVYLVIALTVLFIAGARMIQIGLLLAVVAASVWLVFTGLPNAGIRVLKPYQEQRLTAFLDPANASDSAYQSQQSKTAIGHGGLTGQGVKGATVTRLDFLPEQHTDFIFAAVGEQRGFLGTAILIAVFVLIAWRAIRAVTLAASLYESLIAAGVAAMLVAQVFVNVGMTLGIMPTTGIPLPFMTYGGSNTVTNLIAVGLLLAVQVRGGVPQAPRLAEHDLVQPQRQPTLSGTRG
jgi:rod shape determining protein RodA